MGLEGVMLNEVSRAEENMISLICVILKSQTHKNRVVGTRDWGGGGGGKKQNVKATKLQ